jgi:hypothetical protein
MSSTALTWAFASWVAKSSGYMLTSANVIIVSGHGRGFSVQKKRALISVLAGQDRDITQSYSNFGLGRSLDCHAASDASKLLITAR